MKMKRLWIGLLLLLSACSPDESGYEVYDCGGIAWITRQDDRTFTVRHSQPIGTGARFHIEFTEDGMKLADTSCELVEDERDDAN
jgi:hypothetical protein